ncbi:MAG: hypothetical protein JXA04_00365 [Gammaproteobacteria bacterium]|nr:hypothetical protein [Gammaproteobacteria bacterium]
MKRLTIATFFVLFCQTVSANDSFDVNGHSKYRLFVTEYPDDSIYRQYLGDDANDQNIDIRLNLNWQQSAWRFQADYQFITLYGDTLEFSGQLPPLIFSTDTIQNDDHRLLDLTRVIHEEDDLASLHRLDRLYFGYASGPTVIRFGRQAISWGNGLIYTPMDFFNPFDPSAIDKEYKTGDDMLYGQYLFDSGNDMQAIRVIRRNDEGDINNNVSSTAFKYHGLVGNSEYDLLLAQHYNNNIIGIGGNTSLGGAVLRGDITFTETDTNTISSLVTGVSYSWVWGSTNYSGVLEYFYNGFGINNGDYSPAILIQNPDLLQRIQRGEIYSLGKRYLATSLTIELTPLWLITPSIYHSLSDGSSLFQLLSRHDLSQNLQLLLAIHSPSGSSGTEYGGIPSGIDNLNLGNGNRFFAQLGWYF